MDEGIGRPLNHDSGIENIAIPKNIKITASYTQYQARKQESPGAGETPRNGDTLINASCVAHKRKAPQGKILVLFLQDALKIAF